MVTPLTLAFKQERQEGQSTLMPRQVALHGSQSQNNKQLGPESAAGPSNVLEKGLEKPPGGGDEAEIYVGKIMKASMPAWSRQVRQM